MHSMLNTKPFWADLCVSWSGMLSKPTCPFKLRVRMAAAAVAAAANGLLSSNCGDNTKRGD